MAEAPSECSVTVSEAERFYQDFFDEAYNAFAARPCSQITRD